jgi:hypothetical protein
MDVPIGLRTGEGCEHPRHSHRKSMLGDPKTQRYCLACQCVIAIQDDGTWAAEPTGITSVRVSR